MYSYTATSIWNSSFFWRKYLENTKFVNISTSFPLIPLSSPSRDLLREETKIIHATSCRYIVNYLYSNKLMKFNKFSTVIWMCLTINFPVNPKPCAFKHITKTSDNPRNSLLSSLHLFLDHCIFFIYPCDAFAWRRVGSENKIWPREAKARNCKIRLRHNVKLYTSLWPTQPNPSNNLQPFFSITQNWKT